MKIKSTVLLSLVIFFISLNVASASYYYSNYDWFDDFEDSSINATFWNSSTEASGDCSGGQGTQQATISESGGKVALYTQANCPAGGGSRQGIAKFWTKIDNSLSYDYKIVFNLNGTRTTASGGTSTLEMFISYGNDGSSDVSLDSFLEAEIEVDPSINYTILAKGNTLSLYRNNTQTLMGSGVATQSYQILFYTQSSSGLAGSAEQSIYLYSYLSQSSNITASLVYPQNATSSDSESVFFNATVEAPLFSSINATIFIWNSTNGLFNKTTNLNLGKSLNTTTFTISNFDIGVYKWNVYACGLNATLSNICDWADSNYTFTYGFSENAVSFNASTFETATETFRLNVSLPSEIISSSAVFYHNNTYYGASTKVISGNSITFTNSFDIPLGTGDMDFYWVLNLDGTLINTTINTQEVNLTLFTLTNSTYPNVFLNITFQDESTLGSINASIPSSTFTYYLGSGTINKTFTFSNATDNDYYSFSGTTGNRNLYVLPTLQYRRVSDYPQRIWQPALQTLTSTLTEQILYLLSTTDGIFVTYQVVTIGDTAISGVEVTSTRVVDGDTVQVAAGTTDSAGLVTFWMNPDFEHTTTFVKEGYDTFTYVHFPTQASYTITMGGEVVDPTDFICGITPTIRPSEDFLVRNQLYNFSYSLITTYCNLTSFQFTLTNSTGAVIGSNSSSSVNGGSINLTNINISNSAYITMTYLYTLDDDDSTQVSGTRVWITQTTTGREFSIWQLIQDTNSYLSIGLFGFDDFGKTLLSFLIIILMVGGISKKYGIASEAAIMGVLFGIVFFLDVGLNFIPRVQIGDIVSIEHFFTYITFIILVGIIIYEERR